MRAARDRMRVRKVGLGRRIEGRRASMMIALPSDPPADAGPAPSEGLGEVFRVFLKLGLTSFGGPIAHLGYFRAEFVERRRWLTEQSFADFVALAQFLPGPASSQTGFGIGLLPRRSFGRPCGLGRIHTAFGDPYGPLRLRIRKHRRVLSRFRPSPRAQTRRRGDRGASGDGNGANVVPGPRAGFNRDGRARRDARRALVDPATWRDRRGRPRRAARVQSPGRGRRRHSGRASGASERVSLASRPSLSCSSSAFIPAPAGAVALFDAFYRSGALVFGGGHVVLPLLRTAVVAPAWVPDGAFLAGYGAAQALPGPLFAFAAYLGAVATRAAWRNRRRRGRAYRDLHSGRALLSWGPALLARAALRCSRSRRYAGDERRRRRPGWRRALRSRLDERRAKPDRFRYRRVSVRPPDRLAGSRRSLS